MDTDDAQTGFGILAGVAAIVIGLLVANLLPGSPPVKPGLSSHLPCPTCRRARGRCFTNMVHQHVCLGRVWR